MTDVLESIRVAEETQKTRREQEDNKQRTGFRSCSKPAMLETDKPL